VRTAATVAIARWRASVRLRLLSYVFAGSVAGVVVTLATRPPQDLSLSSPPVRAALKEWTQVAGELVDTVPPRLLLGADGNDATLEKSLEARGLTRSEFRHAANLVIRAVGPCSDDAAREALAAGLAEFPVPEGIQFPDATSSEGIIRTPQIESARTLVLELTARLATAVAAPRDS
jgi:hypothetical protein